VGEKEGAVSMNLVFWGAYVVFVACAFVADATPQTFSFDVQLAPAKLLIWLAYLGFLGYTIHCSRREDLIASMRRIGELSWGRQVGADLYLGLALALFVIFLNERSLLAVVLWALPALFFVNLVTLLYFALHFEELVGKLVG
jgi:hypothetical protein